MATYKVIQDIEAEDKLIGPLTLRQFIYAGIGAIFLYLSYVLATKGAAFMLVFFLPVSAVMGFFAFPWTRDQPTEVWALAKVRFMMKPRRRVWSQDGLKELVTITVPRKVAVDYTDGLSQQEVRSRLQALAATVDTRGWAIKNANLSIPLEQGEMHASDRLVAPMSTPPKVIDDTEIRASDDIMDEKNNASAQRLQQMIDQKSKDHRQELISSLKNDTPSSGKSAPNDYWFLNQPSAAAKIPNDMVTFNTQVVTPGSTNDKPDTAPVDEAKVLAELEAHKEPPVSYASHMRVIKPLSEQTTPQPQAPPVSVPTAPQPQIQIPVPTVPQPQIAAPAVQQPQIPTVQAVPAQIANAPVTPKEQAAILPLASNNDLSVAAIAREAERSLSGDEVVVKLH